MDFELTDEQIMSRDMARKFAEQEILPTLKENERQEKFDPGIIKKMASQGLLAPHMPEEYGGMGLDYVTSTLIWEQPSSRRPTFSMPALRSRKRNTSPQYVRVN